MRALAQIGAWRGVWAALWLWTGVASGGCGETHANISPDAGKQIATGDPHPHPDAGPAEVQQKPDAQVPKQAPEKPERPPKVDPPPQQGFVTFSPRLEGDWIVVDIESTATLSAFLCSSSPRLDKYEEATGYVKLRDDRHPSYNSPGYYLDGEFIPASHNLGCDAQVCLPFGQTSPLPVAPAYEYVKTGTKAPPADAVDSPDSVDVIETRALSGVVRISIDYFDDAKCTAQSGVAIEFMIPVPEDGVCCPIGIENCSAEGPGGGWAPNLDACRPWSVENDAYSEIKPDPRGCPTLVKNYDICCGCVIEEDAGI